MDALAFNGIRLSSQRDFDQILESRAQKHKHLRARKNVTLCRSPTSELNIKLIKNNLKDKRYLEFQRRRPMSPEWNNLKSTVVHSRRNNSFKAATMKNQSLSSKSGTLNTNVQYDSPTRDLLDTKSLLNSRERDTQSTRELASWSEGTILMSLEKGHRKEHAASTSSSELTKQSKNQSSENNTKAVQIAFNEKEKNHNPSMQTPMIIQNTLTGQATEPTYSDLVTVREADIQRLADYLQEALWREETVTRKLFALQDSISGLMGSFDIIWTSRCSEDLLRGKIKTLEAQLHVCMQSIPEHGTKELLVQMETERLFYEEKAVVALQKAMQDRTEALSKADTLQEELVTAKEENMRWTNLCKELKMDSNEIRLQQRLSGEQLQQLHYIVELSTATESELREEVSSLRQQNQDLQYNTVLLEENSQALREEIHQLQDDKDDFMMHKFLLSSNAEPVLSQRRDSEMEEKLRLTQEKLQLKDRECEEVQTELRTMEQECQSSQARLSQCRDELRLLSQNHRTQARCVSRWKVCLLLLFLAVLVVAMFGMCHTSFWELFEDLYTDIEIRIEGYLVQVASSQHPRCFRPT